MRASSTSLPGLAILAGLTVHSSRTLRAWLTLHARDTRWSH
jgi:hypothetical protein